MNLINSPICRFLVLSLIVLAATVTYSNFAGAEGNSVQSVVRYRENFDSVAAPALPAGWTTSATGAGVAFVSVNDQSDTAPNAVFAPNPATTALSQIVSPPVLITGSNSTLTFRHRYALENTWDGAVLEISIADAPFQDILAAGGVFVTGSYTTLLNPSPNPLGGRQAWSGATQGGFMMTSVRLPVSTFGQTVRFRWAVGSNDSFGALGWWIDSVTVEDNPTAANTTPIVLPSQGTADVYPSSVTVNALSGLVTGVTVSVDNISHNVPDDVDLMLVSPDGRRVVLMSDAGGNTPVSGQTFIFSDAAANSVSDNGPLSGGIFKPANYESGDTFPSPAPQGEPTGSTLAAFYGTNPNGTWSLYAVDDNGGNAGVIAGGWTLDLRTSVSACVFTINPAFSTFPAAGGSGVVQTIFPAGCGWSAFTSSGFVTLDSPTTGIGNGSVAYTVAPNTGAARTAIITISDGFSPRTFQIQQAGGCPTSISQSDASFPASGGTANIAVTAGSGCVWQAATSASWIAITSAQQTGNGNASFTVAPNTLRTGRTATVTIGVKTVSVSQAPNSPPRFDFDGDGRGDVSVYRDGVWYLQRSTAGTAVVPFGLATDKLAPADFDGDGKTDVAVYRDGIWYVLQSSNGAFFAVQFGLATDVPLPADMNGDGRAELVVFRSGVWYAFDLATGATSVTTFGSPGDRPVPADYDGDGKTDVAVYRNGDWYLQRSTAGFAVIRFGLSTDRPVGGDFDGDGRADLAVYRDGDWHILSNFQTYSTFRFGIATDVPTAADYDGDGKTDAAVFRSGVWYVLSSSTGGFFAVPFGIATDRPVPAAFLP